MAWLHDRGWSILTTGIFMADEVNVWQAGLVAVVAAENLVNIWWHSVGLPFASFILQGCDPIRVFKEGDNMVYSEVPGMMVLKVDHQQWLMWWALRDFFEASLYHFFGAFLSLSPMEGFSIQCDLGHVMVPHPGDVSCPLFFETGLKGKL